MTSRNFRFLPAPFILSNPLLDSQHDGMLERLHTLSKLTDDAAACECNEIMSDLTGKLAEHFDYEEAIMKDLGLDGSTLFEEHVAAHTAIMEELSHIHLSSITSGYGTARTLAPTVADWIHRHIIEFDLALKPLIEQGARKG